MVGIVHTNGKFTGLPHEDLQLHIRNFIEVTHTYIPLGVSYEVKIVPLLVARSHKVMVRF